MLVTPAEMPPYPEFAPSEVELAPRANAYCPTAVAADSFVPPPSANDLYPHAKSNALTAVPEKPALVKHTSCADAAVGAPVDAAMRASAATPSDPIARLRFFFLWNLAVVMSPRSSEPRVNPAAKATV